MSLRVVDESFPVPACPPLCFHFGKGRLTIRWRGKRFNLKAWNRVIGMSSDGFNLWGS